MCHDTVAFCENYKPLIMIWSFSIFITIDILYSACYEYISDKDYELFSYLLLTPFTFTTSFIIDDLDFQDIFLVIVCRRVTKANARFNGLGCQGWCRDCVWFFHKFMSSKEWRWNLFIMGKSFKCDLTLICYSYLSHLPIFQKDKLITLEIKVCISLFDPRYSVLYTTII